LKGLSKLLICGGSKPYTDTCEVINLASTATTCKNPQNFPALVESPIGGLGLKQNPIICGGVQNYLFSNKCHSLENNNWAVSVDMNSFRKLAAAAQFEDGQLLVTGGYNGSYSPLNSAELLTEEGWERKIPSLPVTIHGHCMVTINSTTVIAIGGWQNGQTSGKTFYITLGEKSWTEGTELKYNRGWHSCGKIRRNKESQEMSIIVAGGHDGSSSLSSVENLDEGSNEWQTGPELPFGIFATQMVEHQNGGVVLIGGAASFDEIFDTLYHLPHGGQDAVWTKMEQKLNTGRHWHTAFLIPDNLVDCS
jgi:hypothetical protein